MTCDLARQRIVLWLCDDLDEAGRAGLESHLAGCADCAAFRSAEERLLRHIGTPRLDEEAGRLLPECRRDLTAALTPSPWRRATRAFLAAPPALRYAAPILGVGILAGGFALGRLTAAPAPMAARADGRAGQVAQAEQATVREIGLTGDEPGRPRVRLAYDTLRQDALEGTARDPEIRRLLVGTLRDSLNPGLRLEAIDALRGQTDDEEVRTALLRAVGEDDNAGARLKALEALQPSAERDPAVRDALMRSLLTDSNPGVRVRAVDALGEARDPDALPVLRRLASGDRNDYVRLRAATLVSDLVTTGAGR